jgi:hypothetical protein
VSDNSEKFNDVQILSSLASMTVSFTGREWVLDQVLDWMENSLERFLFITGEPGCGKTALAAWLSGLKLKAEKESQVSIPLKTVRDNLKSTYFCLATDKRGSVDPTNFAQSLAVQLSRYYEDFTEAMLKSIGVELNVNQEVTENKGQIIGIKIENFVIKTNAENAYNRLIRDPLKDIFQSNPSPPKIFIIVDGLDEALTFEQTNIVSLLAGSNDLPTNVRFLLTSRNEPRVLDQFLQKRIINLSSNEHIVQVNADIKAYLDKRFEEEPLKSVVLNKPQETKDNLVERAAGNFLYIRFLLDEAASGKRSLEDLDSFPKDLFGLYRNYLYRLMPDMLQVGSQVWLEKYQPLLGCLSVAMPSVPLDVLSEWLGRPEGEVAALLHNLVQIVENDLLEDNSFKLYHRSIADFLATATVVINGNAEQNRFWTPPAEQHARIIRYYLPAFEKHWKDCDNYGLRQLTTHIQSRLILEKKSDKKIKQAQDLFSLVLNEKFRTAQQVKLRGKRFTLTDLRTALDVSISQHDLINAIKCVGTYRENIGKGDAEQSNSVIQNIFLAMDSRNIEKALTESEVYRSVQDWGKILHLYLALEAAEIGDVDMSRKALQIANHLPIKYLNELYEAMIVFISISLSQHGNRALSVEEWFDILAPGKEHSIISRYNKAVPLPQNERDNSIKELNLKVNWLTKSIDQENPEALSDAESVAMLTGGLKDLLIKLAADQDAQQSVDRLLGVALSNPYPRYRDIALQALTISCLSVPNLLWVRYRLRGIFEVTLNEEGVSFTFDFPYVLLLEAEKRNLPAASIKDYIKRMPTKQDRWGTSRRMHNATAVALFYQGNKNAALEELRKAVEQPRGYAGYATISLLSLASRWMEFGFKDLALKSAIDAANQASYVRDSDFRAERTKIVDCYKIWLNQGTPTVEAALTVLTSIDDQETKMAYIDQLSARWAYDNNWTALEMLLPFVLGNATTLDALLGRLFGLRLQTLNDENLNETLKACMKYFTAKHPTESGVWQITLFRKM